MKYLSLIFVFSFFFIHTLYADNLKTYYVEINNAELSITNHDYKKAINHYDSAFKNKKSPFAIDIYNQTVCYIKEKNFNEAIIDCFKLAKMGTGSDFFTYNKIFDPLKHQNQWTQLLKKAEYEKNELDNKNKILIQKINSLYASDQKAHILLRAMNPQNEDSISHYVKNVDDSLSNQLMEIFNRNGFLSEFNLEVAIDNSLKIKSMPDFYVIMLHNFQGEKDYDSLFSPILEKAVSTGKVKPYIYAFMLDSNCRDFKKFNGTVMMYVYYQNKLYIQKYCDNPKIKNQINQQRTSLMLPIINDYLKKIIFNLKEPNNEFKIDARCSRIGSFRNKKAEQSIINELNLVTSDL